MDWNQKIRTFVFIFLSSVFLFKGHFCMTLSSYLLLRTNCHHISFQSNIIHTFFCHFHFLPPAEADSTPSHWPIGIRQEAGKRRRYAVRYSRAVTPSPPALVSWPWWPSPGPWWGGKAGSRWRVPQRDCTRPRPAGRTPTRQGCWLIWLCGWVLEVAECFRTSPGCLWTARDGGCLYRGHTSRACPRPASVSSCGCYGSGGTDVRDKEDTV